MLGGLTLSGLQTGILAADGDRPITAPKSRTPLIVKPVLAHDLPQRKDASSWRQWGGIETKEQAEEEVGRIRTELVALQAQADYPIEFLEVSTVTDIHQMKEHPDIAKCDVVLLYAAGLAGIGGRGVPDFGKDVILFLRWKSGPVYMQYETASVFAVRWDSDVASDPRITNADIVVDKPEELDWRFRALCGLKNTKGTKIVTIGGANSLAPEPDRAITHNAVKNIWNIEYHNVSYDELSELIDEARADAKMMERAKQRAEAYLKIPGTILETTMEFFVNNFVIDDIFRLLMKKVDTHMITVSNCMRAIMPRARTSACMTLCTLNDDGYKAFCESDFVVIPSGILLGNISGKPVFLNDPTYPHDNIVTVAHCTGPRKMDGKNYDPVRIVTHFESDFGAAPHVEVPLGTITTNIIPDFKSVRWVGFKGTIVDVPFRPICRTQFDLEYEFPAELLAERTVGFHWMTCFGDYRKEIGYALRRVGIQWDNLDNVPYGAR